MKVAPFAASNSQKLGSGVRWISWFSLDMNTKAPMQAQDAQALTYLYPHSQPSDNIIC